MIDTDVSMKVQSLMEGLKGSLDELQSLKKQAAYTTNVNIAQPQPQNQLAVEENSAEQFFKHILNRNPYFDEFCSTVLGLTNEELLDEYKLFIEIKDEEKISEQNEKKKKIKEKMKKKVTPKIKEKVEIKND